MRRITVFSCSLVGVVWAWFLLSAMLSAQSASSPALFSPGVKYAVIWDCVPEFLGQAVSAAMFGGAPLNPCFAEELTVQAVRSDGWLLVTDVDGTGWTVNPQRAIGFKVAEPQLRAVR